MMSWRMFQTVVQLFVLRFVSTEGVKKWPSATKRVENLTKKKLEGLEGEPKDYGGKDLTLTQLAVPACWKEGGQQLASVFPWMW